MIYPTGLTNYFHPSAISDSATVTTLIEGPLVLKSFVCGMTSDNDTDTGSYIYKLFDGSEEIFRIYTGVSYGAFNSRFCFQIPLNGLRLGGDLGISIESVDTLTGLEAVGISVLYQG